MSEASDLRERARKLREELPPRRTATPPAENGRRIGTIERSADEQIRVNWSEFEGKPFVSLPPLEARRRRGMVAGRETRDERSHPGAP